MRSMGYDVKLYQFNTVPLVFYGNEIDILYSYKTASSESNSNNNNNIIITQQQLNQEVTRCSSNWVQIALC